MFKKLDIYIIRKFLGTFIFTIILLISISVVFDLTEKMEDFIEKQAPLSAIIFDYYLNFIPYFINLFSSLVIFLAVIFFTSKMTYNSEIIAILSSGVSFKRFLLPYFVSSGILACVSFALTNYIIPPANKQRLAFEEKYIRNPLQNYDINIHKQISPGLMVYMESYNVANMIGYKFSLEQFEDKKLKSKLIADYAKWDTITEKWQVSNYYIRDIDSTVEHITRGRKIDTVLNIRPKDFALRENIVETMNYDQLNDFIDELIVHGVDNLEIYLVEKYRRIAFPFSTFILTIIGVTLAIRRTKGGIGFHIGFGLLLSFTYILFMQITAQFAINGGMNPILAVWIPNIIFSIVGIALYLFAPK